MGEWAFVPVERRFRHCPRCQGQWPESYETCPVCVRWLGDRLTSRLEYWFFPPPDLPRRVWKAAERLRSDVPPDFPGPLVPYASVLAVRLAVDPARFPTERLQPWFQAAEAILLEYDALPLAARTPGLCAVFLGEKDDRDHAQLAVQTAWELLSRATGLGLEEAAGVRLFLGVNTGPVAIRLQDGEWQARGACLERAEQLATALGPGRVILSAATYTLSQDVYEAYGVTPLERTDASFPAVIYALRGPQEVVSWRGLLESKDTPLVGRERELGILSDAFQKARQGHGQVVHLVAEAGTGKSRLLGAFASQVATTGQATVWQGWAPCYGGAPYALLRELLAPVFLPAGLPRQAALAELQARLNAVGADRSRTSHALMWLFRLHEPGEVTQPDLADMLDALVQAAAASGPLVIVLDDLHWADPSSLEVLSGALARWRRAAVLTILSYRPSLAARFAPKAFVSDLHILLAPLATTDADRLLSALAPGIAPGLRRRLLASAKGNPLFVEEAVGLLEDLGLLDAPEAAAELPATLPELLLRRIERWSDVKISDLERTTAWSAMPAASLVPAVEAVERQIDDWLDRIEAGGYVGRYELGRLLRPLRAVEGRLLRLRWRLGVAAPRHSRLRRAAERLYAGFREEWCEAIRALAEETGDRLSAIHQAIEAAEVAELRRDRAGATAFYRLALSMLSLTDAPRGVVPLERLHTSLGKVLLERGHLAEARAAFRKAVEAASVQDRATPLVLGALAAAWEGRDDEVGPFAEALQHDLDMDVGEQPESQKIQARRVFLQALAAIVRREVQAPSAVAEATATLSHVGCTDWAIEAALLQAALGGSEDDAATIDGLLSLRPTGGIEAADVRLLLLLSRLPGPAGNASLREHYLRHALRIARASCLDGWEERVASLLGKDREGSCHDIAFPFIRDL